MIKRFWEQLRASIQGFGQDHVSILAASLAYFAAFALAPLLLVAVAVAGFVLGPAAASGRIVNLIQGTVGRSAAELLQNLMAGLNQPHANIIAAVIGGAALLLGASGLFLQLQTALNIIWRTRPQEQRGVLNTVINRVTAFAAVLGTGLLLLVFLLLNSLLRPITSLVSRFVPGVTSLLPLAPAILGLLLFWLAFSTLFKGLTRSHLAWKDAGKGGLLTSLLFNVGMVLIALYLSHSGSASLYGAVSALFLLLLWLYYSAQIFLFGAEFTKACSRRNEAEGNVPGPKDAGKKPAGYSPLMLAGLLTAAGYWLGKRAGK